MALNSLKAVNDAYSEGRSRYTGWRKVVSQAVSAATWYDVSMTGGNPTPQYYASSPLVSAVLNGATGLFHGGAVAPLTKHLHRILVQTISTGATPTRFLLCDYLLYYPFVDMSITEEQPLENTVSLPRFSSGLGVYPVPVLLFPQIGNSTFQITYTNHLGVSGRVSPVIRCNAATAVGTIICTSPNLTNTPGAPYFPLAAGDLGVRSIESISFNIPDVGLIALVLVKPIASFTIRGGDAPSEVDFLADFPSLPPIADGAYLNFFAHPNTSYSGISFQGDATFIWG